MSDCIFCKIINGEIPSKKVLENDKFYAFHDIEPVKKVHVLIVPKNHVANIAHLTEKNEDYVEGLLPFVRDVAKELGISKDGYRSVSYTHLDVYKRQGIMCLVNLFESNFSQFLKI